jgi:hypothetical protein
MKKFLSIAIIAALTLVAACRKNDNTKLPDGIAAVPIPLFTKAEGNTLLIQDAANFTTKFSVGLYFPDAAKPKKLDIMVAMNGYYATDAVKVLKADVSTYPTDITVTGAELAQLFGITTADIVAGNKFEIRANITLNNGTVVKGFTESKPTIDSTTGDTTSLQAFLPYGTDVTTFPGSNPTITFRAVCPLDLDAFVGTFTMDDPDFYEGSYPVTIERDGTDRLKLTGFASDGADPEAVFYLTVDALEQTISIEDQKYTDVLFGDYHNARVNGTGVIDACGTTITLTLNNSVDEGSFSAVDVTIHK